MADADVDLFIEETENLLAEKVIEDGTHAELLARGGHYARMWSMQAGGFLPEQETGKVEV